MNGWMYSVWMDRWMDRRMDEQIDRRIDGYIHVDRPMDGKLNIYIETRYNHNMNNS